MEGTHAVTISPKHHIPKKVWMTPLTADEIICVTGLVTLILRNPAIQIKNPNTPVMTAPPTNVLSVLPPCKNMSITIELSPDSKTRGDSRTAERRLL